MTYLNLVLLTIFSPLILATIFWIMVGVGCIILWLTFILILWPWASLLDKILLSERMCSSFWDLYHTIFRA